MKKLRALFAILLAVCMLCSMAIAETEVEEVVLDEVVATEAPADEPATATDTVATEEATQTDSVDANEDITQNPGQTPTDDDHTTVPDPKEDIGNASELHNGEVEFDVEELRPMKKGETKEINGVEFVCTQAFDCGKGQDGMYEYQCQVDSGYGVGLDKYGYVIWHRYGIPATHLWASEAHVTNEDWAMVEKEASCTETGIGTDYCLRCGAVHKDAAGNTVTREIAPMGHSFKNPDDKRVKLVVKTLPTCVSKGTVELQCVICGATMVSIPGVTADEMHYLAQTAATSDAHYQDWNNLGDVESIANKVPDIWDYVWDNREQFQMQYVNWVEHDYDGWFTPKGSEPTCAKEGLEIRTCKICGEKYKRTTPPLVANYKLDKSKTMLLDCYHEAQVWECENCHGKVHPDLIRVRRVVSHDKDERVAALIDQAEADPTVTTYTYNGKQVYQAPTCEKAGWKYYICKHENDEEHALNEGEIEPTFAAKYPKVTAGFELWRGNNMWLGYEIIYDAETESIPAKWIDYFLTGTSVWTERPVQSRADDGLTDETGWSGDRVDNKWRHDTTNYEYDNREWASESYHENVFGDYNHANDTTDNPKATGYYINWANPALSYYGQSIAALGHDWSAWKQLYGKNENGGDNEYAYYQRICKRCGKVQELVGTNLPDCESLKPAEQHDWKLISATKATCTTAGEEVYQCTKCGKPMTKTTAAALGHAWDEGKVIKEATCTEAGVKVFTCKNDATHTMNEEIPAKGHTIVEIPAVPATTTATGLTAGKKCSVCGEILEAPVEVPMITVDNKYEIDLDKVTKGGETRGTGEVKIVEGNQKAPQLYARVTWVYELANGDSFAYCAMKEVKSAEDALTFNMTSPKQPYGATLVDVQIALVTDAEADASGSYNALATAKK